MELIDRYLAAVGILLPRDQREDITAELRDVLLTHREDKEAELGRPLTRAEGEALLMDFGHPAAVVGDWQDVVDMVEIVGDAKDHSSSEIIRSRLSPRIP